MYHQLPWLLGYWFDSGLTSATPSVITWPASTHKTPWRLSACDWYHCDQLIAWHVMQRTHTWLADGVTQQLSMSLQLPSHSAWNDSISLTCLIHLKTLLFESRYSELWLLFLCTVYKYSLITCLLMYLTNLAQLDNGINYAYIFLLLMWLAYYYILWHLLSAWQHLHTCRNLRSRIFDVELIVFFVFSCMQQILQ